MSKAVKIIVITICCIVGAIVVIRLFQPLIYNSVFSSVPHSLTDTIDSEINAYCINVGAKSGCFPSHGIESAQKAISLTEFDKASGVTEIWCINYVDSYKGLFYIKNHNLWAKYSADNWSAYYPEDGGEEGWTSRGCKNYWNK